MSNYNPRLEKRFLNYVSFETTSDPYNDTVTPSTKNQFALANYLCSELHNMQVTNALVDEHAYVYAYIPSSSKSNITVGLIAHMDTSSQASGKNISPSIIDEYDGSIIKLKNGLSIDPLEFPHIKKSTGDRLIVTDGTTLLGADDKAGIAIILELVEQIMKKETTKEFPNLIITFTPDEEIGNGTACFNYDYYKEHQCSIAYTLDGGPIDMVAYENFNAASCVVNFTGKSIHPGSAKNKMVNAVKLAMEFDQMLPIHEVPEATTLYEGFHHLDRMTGTVASAKLEYIIRNHDLAIFEKQKALFLDVASFMNKKYGPVCNVLIKDSYYNMKDLVLAKEYLLTSCVKALEKHHITCQFDPIRGGTDGARLSFEGIITPNLGTGGGNFHGPLEYLNVTEASLMVDVLKDILESLK